MMASTALVSSANSDRAYSRQGAMDKGSVSDHIEGASTHALWLDSAKTSLFKSRRSIELIAYRCADCGYVELYAPQR
jgi:hypothetical protein